MRSKTRKNKKGGSLSPDGRKAAESALKTAKRMSMGFAKITKECNNTFIEMVDILKNPKLNLYDKFKKNNLIEESSKQIKYSKIKSQPIIFPMNKFNPAYIIITQLLEKSETNLPKPIRGSKINLNFTVPSDTKNLQLVYDIEKGWTGSNPKGSSIEKSPDDNFTLTMDLTKTPGTQINNIKLFIKLWEELNPIQKNCLIDSLVDSVKSGGWYLLNTPYIKSIVNDKANKLIENTTDQIVDNTQQEKIEDLMKLLSEKIGSSDKNKVDWYTITLWITNILSSKETIERIINILITLLKNLPEPTPNPISKKRSIESLTSSKHNKSKHSKSKRSKSNRNTSKSIKANNQNLMAGFESEPSSIASSMQSVSTAYFDATRPGTADSTGSTDSITSNWSKQINGKGGTNKTKKTKKRNKHKKINKHKKTKRRRR